MSSQARPLIGITCSTQIGGAWGTFSPGAHLHFLDETYSQSVEGAGGLPIILPLSRNEDLFPRLLERLDGLILSGGPDIMPRLYGDEPRPGLGEVNIELDMFEIALTRRALETDMPILGICRGIQMLSAAGGGDLHQDVELEVKGSLKHRVPADKKSLSHKVQVNKPSLLHSIVGSEELWVNSGHHQAVKTPPAGWQVSARAVDGVIEALEHPGHRFRLGVQWHPEGTYCHDQPSQAIFQAFVKAAARVI